MSSFAVGFDRHRRRENRPPVYAPQHIASVNVFRHNTPGRSHRIERPVRRRRIGPADGRRSAFGGGRADRSRSERRRATVTPEQRLRGHGSDRARRRLDRGVHRLSGTTRQRSRSVQGRGALQPVDHEGRMRGPLDGDDVEMRSHGHPVRRGERWRAGEPEGSERARTRTAHPTVYPRNRRHYRADDGHPRTGHGNRCPDDGVDHGRVQYQRRRNQAGCRDREADVDRRQRRA